MATQILPENPSAEQTLRAALEGVRDFLRHAPLESGVCCCGDLISAHNMGSGHAPVDMLHHAVDSQIEFIDAALKRAKEAA